MMLKKSEQPKICLGIVRLSGNSVGIVISAQWKKDGEESQKPR